MYNHIGVAGRLVRDPDLRRTGTGKAVANFTIAHQRDFGLNGEKETDFFDCVAWQKTAEFVEKYFRKGSLVFVSGRLQIRTWTDASGAKRKSAEIMADNCYFGEAKKPQEESSPYTPPPRGSAYPETEAYLEKLQQGHMDFTGIPYPSKQDDFAVLDDEDGQLPF